MQNVFHINTSIFVEQQLDDELNVVPGSIIVDEAPSVLWSTVGSGLLVCLWDKVDQIGGMNHFLLPGTSDPAKTTGKFGNAAMHGLLSMLYQRSTIGLFEATIIGAAFSDEFEEENGRLLVSVAEQFLAKDNIPIVLQETGGCNVRKVTFCLKTGKIGCYPLIVERLRGGNY